ncbi:MAG: hypothetical protein MZU79_00405 [Anaerotruncus sp.]|nr:hypothetical protein [Anaerotruncus sp.]
MSRGRNQLTRGHPSPAGPVSRRRTAQGPRTGPQPYPARFPGRGTGSATLPDSPS